MDGKIKKIFNNWCLGYNLAVFGFSFYYQKHPICRYRFIDNISGLSDIFGIQERQKRRKGI